VLGEKTLRIGFGFDSSARADSDTIRTIRAGMLFLLKMVVMCVQQSDCGCSSEVCTVQADYDYNRANKPAPEIAYIFPRDRALAVSNIGRIKAQGSPVLITWRGLYSHGDFKPAGSWEGVGSIYNVQDSDDVAIAHELGHVVGYVGDADDRHHSTDENNLMYYAPDPTGNGLHPDCQWCQKVMALAQ